MRPTDLQFRNPKERTPAFYDSQVSNTGRINNFTPPKYRNRASFSNSKRFTHYKEVSKRTGYLIGPGCYDIHQRDIGRNRIKGTPRYRRYHGGKQTGNNAYVMIGNHLVYDPNLKYRHKRRRTKELSCDMDALLTDRPKSVESKRSSMKTYDTDYSTNHTPIRKRSKSIKLYNIKRMSRKSPYLMK